MVFRGEVGGKGNKFSYLIVEKSTDNTSVSHGSGRRVKSLGVTDGIIRRIRLYVIGRGAEEGKVWKGNWRVGGAEESLTCLGSQVCPTTRVWWQRGNLWVASGNILPLQLVI